MPAKEPATISAMDITVPPAYYLQDTYPNQLFNVCKLNHKEELKTKYKSFCTALIFISLRCGKLSPKTACFELSGLISVKLVAGTCFLISFLVSRMEAHVFFDN
jgi:hypothetical protein